jgi:hypothetical protein
MGHQPQNIRHPSQLAALTVWRLMPSLGPGRVLIDAEAASADRVRSWERQLSRLQTACGCEQGALGLLVGVIGYMLFLLLRSGGWGHPARKEFLIGLGVVVATTCVGKLLGLWLAQRRLDRVIKEIQSQWKPHDSVDPDSRYAGVKGPDSRIGSTPCCGGPWTTLLLSEIPDRASEASRAHRSADGDSADRRPRWTRSSRTSGRSVS